MYFILIIILNIIYDDKNRTILRLTIVNRAFVDFAHWSTLATLYASVHAFCLITVVYILLAMINTTVIRQKACSDA